jgi:hypothetical protein
LDLDSIGGEIGETERIAGVIQELRRTTRVDTLVRHGSMCASACVAVFAQGERRSAGGSSIWLFHGVCAAGSNIPSYTKTCQALEMLRKAGVHEKFLQMLLREGYVTRPGALWVSGYELYHVYDSGLVTRLLDPWQPEDPVPLGSSGISPR